MFDIHNYYLGVILAHPNYFQNSKSRIRAIQDIEADPFSSLTLEQALITGVVTLLRKEGDSYYDEDYSRYKNELHYELYKTNSLGIALVYVKPFVECYHEEAVFYTQEDVLLQPEVLEEMALSHSYYVMHSKVTNQNAIVINDYEPMSMVREEYLRNLLESNQFDGTEKKLKK